MGIFGSRRKTYVGTTVSRAIEDDGLPDAVKSGLLNALFQQGDVTQYAMEALVGSLGIKADRMYRWAEQNYTWGLPKGDFYDATQFEAEIKAVLETIESATVSIDYSRVGSPNNLHHGWVKLVNDYGYNQSTNEIEGMSVTKGFPVYLENMQVVTTRAVIDAVRPRGLHQWGTSPQAGYTPTRVSDNSHYMTFIDFSPIMINEDSDDEFMLVTAVWQEPDPNPAIAEPVNKKEFFHIPYVGYDDEKDYVMARYVVDGATKYWVYEKGAGTYPTLDALYGGPAVEAGQFYPWLYFRFDKENEGDNPTSDSYLQNKKMAQMLGMDYDSVLDSIHENPDIDDIEQAMLMFGVSAKSTNQNDIRYLYSFFNNMFLSVGRQYLTPTEAGIRDGFDKNPDIIATSREIQDGRFKMTLRNGGIFKRRRVGIIGPVGKYQAENGVEQFTIVTRQYIFDPIQGAQDTIIVEHETDIPVYYYRKQVGANLYDEIRIVDLEMQFHIFGKYLSTSDDDQDLILVPVDRTLMEGWSIRDKEELFARAMHYIFNSRVTVKVKWYQSSFFRFVLVVAAVAITIVSLGNGFPALAAAIAGGSLAAIALAAWAIIQSILINMLIGYAFQLFIDLVGVEIALIVALVAAAYGAYQALDAGSLAGAPMARDLLTLSTGLSRTAQETLQEQMGDLIGQASEFDKFVKEQMELLENAQKELDGSLALSPFVVFGESPEDYYNRTVHSGNIGVLSISAITHYVDAALTLPRIPETLGGTDVEF